MNISMTLFLLRSYKQFLGLLSYIFHDKIINGNQPWHIFLPSSKIVTDAQVGMKSCGEAGVA